MFIGFSAADESNRTYGERLSVYFLQKTPGFVKL